MASNRLSRSIVALLAGGLAGSALACSAGVEPPSGEVGTAQAAIANVPNDGTVACISITATGSFETTRSFDVSPGQSTVFTLSGIPIGTVRFDGAAFATPCAVVTPGSTPTWVSAPVLTTVAVGSTTLVTLAMQPASAVGVGVEFDAGPACSQASDCPGTSTECRVVVCSSGTCGLSMPPAGTVVAGQTQGDCRDLVCNGTGSVIVVDDDADVPADDGNPCTIEICQAGSQGVIPAALGTPCAHDGGHFCDGSGACVQCTSSADCPSGTACASGACVMVPQVASTTPADGATVPAGSSVAVAFTQAMNPTTLTAQATAGPCAGSIQVSLDGFASCVAFPLGPVMTAGGTVATLTAVPGLLVNRGYKVRVTTMAESTEGAPLAATYTSPTGFTMASPRGCAPSVVISQVWGAGGFNGAAYQNDFVELHNRGAAPASLSGLSLQYAIAASTTWTVIPLSGTIPGGGYYLVQFASAGGVGATLPAPDLTSAVNIASGSGKIALIDGTVALPPGPCPSAAVTLDFFGYGTASCAEGTAAPLLGAAAGAIRGAAGCADNDANIADFDLGPPLPRNSASPPSVCACAEDHVRNESGGAAEADYCATVSPLSVVVQSGATGPVISGRIHEAGVTGQGAGSPSVLAQLGYGPPDANPQHEPGWTWIPATYNTACAGCGSEDEYQASFTAPAVGVYAYVYRFSLDRGQTWTLCDLAQGDFGAGSGAGLSFDLHDQGSLLVTP